MKLLLLGRYTHVLNSEYLGEYLPDLGEYLGRYTHVLNSEYAVRVHDAYTYDAVSREIIGRWAYPFVPDANLLPGSTYRRA